MKIMNIFRIIFASALLIAGQADAAPRNTKKVRRGASAAIIQPSAVEIESAVDKVSDEVRQGLESATSQAAEQITAATIAKNNAIMAGIEGTMTPEAVKAKVDAQDTIIVEIKQNLMKLAEGAVAVVDEATSYASQFVTGAQRLGAQVWNPHAAYEKDLARAIIARLEEEKKNTTNPALIKQLDQQINDQKLITGDKMSTRQLLLIGAVTAAAAVAGVYLGSSYLGQLPEGLSTTEQSTQPTITIEPTVMPAITIEPTVMPAITIEPTVMPAITTEPIMPTPGQKIIEGLQRDVPKAYQGVANLGEKITGAVKKEVTQSIKEVEEVAKAFIGDEGMEQIKDKAAEMAKGYQDATEEALLEEVAIPLPEGVLPLSPEAQQLVRDYKREFADKAAEMAKGYQDATEEVLLEEIAIPLPEGVLPLSSESQAIVADYKRQLAEQSAPYIEQGRVIATPIVQEFGKKFAAKEVLSPTEEEGASPSLETFEAAQALRGEAAQKAAEGFEAWKTSTAEGLPSVGMPQAEGMPLSEGFLATARQIKEKYGKDLSDWLAGKEEPEVMPVKTPQIVKPGTFGPGGKESPMQRKNRENAAQRRAKNKAKAEAAKAAREALAE